MDLGVRPARDRGQVVVPGDDPALQAQAQFTGTVQQVTQGIRARRDEMALHKARIHYQKALIEAESIYDDPNLDLDAALTQHHDALQKARSNSLGMVKNNRMQEILAEDLSLAELRAIDAGQSKLRTIERDRGLADMNDILASAREVALVRDFDLAMNVANDAIATARSSGYIDAVQEQGLRQRYAQEVAQAAISVKPLKEQKELLSGKNPLSDVIPTDVRKNLLESVNGRLVLEEGMIAADEIRLAGGGRTDRLNKARAIKDPDVRQAAVRQVEHDLQQEKMALAETQYDAYQELAKDVIAGQTPAAVIAANPQAWDALSAEQQSSLLSMTPKQETDLNVYNNLNRLAATNQEAAYEYFLENAHRLTPADAQKWSDRLAKPNELDGYLTRSQRLGVMLNEAGVKRDSRKFYRAIEEVDKDFLQFMQDNNRRPNPQEEQAILDGVFEKVIDTAWYNPFASDKYGFDLTPEQRRGLREQRRMDKFEDILQQYEAARAGESEVPVVLSPEEIDLVYRNADRMGLLDD